MNIIKFKDTVIPENEWYNSTIRGKYTYWIHCRYVVSFNDLDKSIYYELEKMNNDGIVDELINSEIHYLDLEDADEWVNNYVDLSATESINSISKYIYANSFVPDDDITLDELKKFRTWLATNLLELKEWNDNDKHVLTYYKEGMSDDIVKWLNIFGSSSPITISSTNIVPCGCSGNGNLSSLYNESLVSCNSLSIYKNNIKLAMVTLFSNIDSWKDLPVEFLNEIIKYLNGIIKADLLLVSSSNLLDVYSCKCLSDVNLAQSQAQSLLQDLIKVFEWIRDGEVNGHKNNIYTTLSNWANGLYEIMEWI